MAGFEFVFRPDMQGMTACGWVGQFGVGLLLGVVWSPCAGTTLGAASALAAQSGGVAAAAATMSSFGFGAALPLALVGFVSRSAWIRWRGAAIAGGKTMKIFLAILFVMLETSMLDGVDRKIEVWAVAASPDWFVRLTTRF